MIVSYLIYVTFMFLCEDQILHPYGTDHINQVESIDNDMYRINWIDNFEKFEMVKCHFFLMQYQNFEFYL